MSTPKGWPTQEKDARLKAEFATVEAVRTLQHGLSVLAHLFTYQVGTDAAEAGSTTSDIKATAHAAQKGDIIKFTSGAYSGREIKVHETSTDLITLGETLAAAPGAGDAFRILRHTYPVIAADGSISVTPTSTGDLSFLRNGSSQIVTEDTGTPANNRPLPVKLTGVTGDLTITAQNLNIQSTHTGANPDSMQIGDGTETVAVNASSELQVADDMARTSLSAISGKLPATLGQKAMAASLAVVLASDQTSIPVTDGGGSLTVDGTVAVTDGGGSITVDGTIAATQSGAWNITNISGTVSLPTGASTSALQTTGNTSLSNIDSKLPATLGQKAMAASFAVVIASDQTVIPISDNGGSITVDGTVAVTDGGGSITVDGTIAATQSGNWSSRTQDGAGTAITSATIGTRTGIDAADIGFSAIDKVRNDYSSVNVTTGAYVQLIASLASECREVEIFDSSGQTLFLAIGAAASEVNQIYIIPGGNGRVKLRIASGTRISVKAVSATASSGELTINFYG